MHDDHDDHSAHDDYDRYVYLVDLFRRNQYQEKAIYDDCPFLIQDPLFNSILCRANQALLEIADHLKEDTTEIREWVEQTTRSISAKLWCERCRIFECYDFVRKSLIHGATAAGFMPLLAGAADAGGELARVNVIGPGFPVVLVVAAPAPSTPPQPAAAIPGGVAVDLLEPAVAPEQRWQDQHDEQAEDDPGPRRPEYATTIHTLSGAAVPDALRSSHSTWWAPPARRAAAWFEPS